MRYRWLLLVVGAVMSGLTSVPISSDVIRFARAGGQLLHGDVSTIYATGWMQAGPLEILGSYLLLPAPHQHLAGYLIANRSRLLLLHLLAGALLVGGLMIGVRRLRGRLELPPSARSECAVGVACLIINLPVRQWQGTHLAELMIPVFWLWAGSLAVRGRTLSAAAVFGLSAGWEPWGVLAAGVLLVERRPARLLAGGAVFALCATGTYLPFVFTGHFALFQQTWPISPGTLVHRLWPLAGVFSWPMRLLQGTAAGLSGCAVAILLGRRRDTIWLAPLAVVAVRLLFDPLNLDYYWIPLSIFTLIGIGLLHTGCSSQRIGCVLALGCLCAPALMIDPALLLVAFVLLIAVLVLLLRCSSPLSSTAPQPPRLPPGLTNRLALHQE